jgi:pentatricopeptide repeat protein
MLPGNIFLSNLVIQMYANCEAPQESLSFFESMSVRDIYSWNFMLKAYVNSGDMPTGIQLFEQAQQEGNLPNRYLYITLLSLFSSDYSGRIVSYGKAIHAQVIAGLEYLSDVVLQTAILSMYGKCGNLQQAKSVFDGMPDRDHAAWNAIISGYAQHGHRKIGIELLQEMRKLELLPNIATLVTLLGSCSNPSALSDGRWIHEHIKGTELEKDLVACNALVAMYGKCGSLDDARAVFDTMDRRDKVTYLNVFAACACACEASLEEAKKLHECWLGEHLGPEVAVENCLINMYGKCGGLREARMVFDQMADHNLISWNSLLSGYAHSGQGSLAMSLLRQMVQEGMMPNKITFISSIDACASLGDEIRGRQLHASIRTAGYELDLVLGTALIHLYGKCHSILDAQEIFCMMDEVDTACWNAIITVYSQHEEADCALRLFAQMHEECAFPDKITFVSMITSCSDESSFREGKRLHARIAQCWLNSDINVSNSLINMYGKCGSLEDAQLFFDLMSRRDNISYVNMFSLCAGKATLLEGRQLHASIMGTPIEADVVVGNALINMYGKCGSLRHAKSCFKRMPEKNVVSWNGMLSAYAQNGLGEITLGLFDKMKCSGIAPNAVTFVCILCACSHAGLLSEGYGYFCSMACKQGMEPNADHYNCMVDMLTRAGMLDEAEELIKRMPFTPSVVTWTTLLGACRNQVDAERAVRAAYRLLRLDPIKSSAYVTLSNIFNAAGRGEDAVLTMKMMKDCWWQCSYSDFNGDGNTRWGSMSLGDVQSSNEEELEEQSVGVV